MGQGSVNAGVITGNIMIIFGADALMAGLLALKVERDVCGR